MTGGKWGSNLGLGGLEADESEAVDTVIKDGLRFLARLDRVCGRNVGQACDCEPLALISMKSSSFERDASLSFSRGPPVFSTKSFCDADEVEDLDEVIEDGLRLLARRNS
jgi:hypothetical protein